MFPICTYSNLTFGLQLLSTIFFHFFDIATDISILIDLKEKNSEYFNVCLGILIMSLISSVGPSIKSLRVTTIRKETIYDKILLYFGGFIVGILQIPFLYDIKLMMQIKEKTKLFSDIRITEVLLESSPEALFQIFIVLKEITDNDNTSLSKYYLSIGSSVVSLISGIVSYEVFSHNYFILCSGVEYDEEEEKEKTKEPKKYNIVKRKLKYNTIYTGSLFVYRTFEVISRLGLLSCLGLMYGGYAIIISLSSEFVLSNVAVFIRFLYYHGYVDGFNYFREKGDIYITDIYDEQGYRLKGMENELRNMNQNKEKDKVEKEKEKETIPEEVPNPINYTKSFVICFSSFIGRVKNIPLYADGFVPNIIKSEYYIDYFGNEMNEKDEVPESFKSIDYWCDSSAWHFILKYINGVTISTMIIIKLTNEIYPTSIKALSITSMCFLILNIPMILLLNKWTNNPKEYDDVFKPIDLWCISSCSCDCVYGEGSNEEGEEGEEEYYYDNNANNAF